MKKSLIFSLLLLAAVIATGCGSSSDWVPPFGSHRTASVNAPDPDPNRANKNDNYIIAKAGVATVVEFKCTNTAIESAITMTGEGAAPTKSGTCGASFTRSAVGTYNLTVTGIRGDDVSYSKPKATVKVVVVPDLTIALKKIKASKDGCDPTYPYIEKSTWFYDGVDTQAVVGNPSEQPWDNGDVIGWLFTPGNAPEFDWMGGSDWGKFTIETDTALNAACNIKELTVKGTGVVAADAKDVVWSFSFEKDSKEPVFGDTHKNPNLLPAGNWFVAGDVISKLDKKEKVTGILTAKMFDSVTGETVIATQILEIKKTLGAAFPDELVDAGFANFHNYSGKWSDGTPAAGVYPELDGLTIPADAYVFRRATSATAPAPIDGYYLAEGIPAWGLPPTPISDLQSGYYRVITDMDSSGFDYVFIVPRIQVPDELADAGFANFHNYSGKWSDGTPVAGVYPELDGLTIPANAYVYRRATSATAPAPIDGYYLAEGIPAWGLPPTPISDLQAGYYRVITDMDGSGFDYVFIVPRLPIPDEMVDAGFANFHNYSGKWSDGTPAAGVYPELDGLTIPANAYVYRRATSATPPAAIEGYYLAEGIPAWGLPPTPISDLQAGYYRVITDMDGSGFDYVFIVPNDFPKI